MKDTTGSHKQMYSDNVASSQSIVNRQILSSLEGNKKKLSDIDKKCDRIANKVDSLQTNMNTLMDFFLSNKRKPILQPDMQDSAKIWHNYKPMNNIGNEFEMMNSPYGYQGYSHRTEGPYIGDTPNVPFHRNVSFPPQYGPRYHSIARETSSSGSGETEPPMNSAEYGGSSISTKSIPSTSNRTQRGQSHFDSLSFAKSKKTSLKRDRDFAPMSHSKLRKVPHDNIDPTIREPSTHPLSVETGDYETSAMNIAAKRSTLPHHHEDETLGAEAYPGQESTQEKQSLSQRNAYNLQGSNSPSMSHSPLISAYSSSVPQYALEKSLKTISEIWREYSHGINDKPPLKVLESKYGTKWRNESESRTYLRRKRIYDAIEFGIHKGLSEESIIEDLENHRTYEINGSYRKRPLSWLVLNIPSKYIGNPSEPIGLD